MRLTILALFLFAGATAICQSTVPAPANPDKPRPVPPMFNWPGTDFSKFPPFWDMKGAPPQRYLVLPKARPARQRSNAQFDPQMIIHPPQSRLGLQPQGTPMMQNEYPGLQLLPIELSSIKMEAIPTSWPNLKLQAIPIAWPKLDMLPVDSKGTVGTRPSAQ